MTVIERIKRRIAIDENGCWVWQGHKKPDGYGRMRLSSGRQASVHRVAFEAWNGQIGRGLHIDHLCRNPSCCNPDHLEAVTPGENTRRSRSAEVSRAKRETQTHCIHGHMFTAENSYFDARGYRSCKECRRHKNETWAVLRRKTDRPYRTFTADAPNVVSIKAAKNG